MENSVSSTKNSKMFLTLRKYKKILQILFVIALVVLAFCLVYKSGYNSGKKEGMKAGEKIANANKSTNMQDFSSFLPVVVSGDVSNIGKNDITIKDPTGKEKKLTFDAKLRVTKKGQTSSATAITKGAKVVAYTKPGSPTVATRIILR